MGWDPRRPAVSDLSHVRDRVVEGKLPECLERKHKMFQCDSPCRSDLDYLMKQRSDNRRRLGVLEYLVALQTRQDRWEP